MAARETTEHPPTIWTVANIVTCIRIACLPVWLGLALWIGKGVDATSGMGLAAAAITTALYALIALTDKLDGYLARSRGEVTNFGKFLDPIADKLVVVSALVLLVSWGLTSVWFVVIIVAREFLVSGMRMVVAASGTVVAASELGKAKTAVTMVAIMALLLGATFPMGVFSEWVLLIGHALMLVAVVLTAVSGFDYFWKCRHVLLAPEPFEGQGSAADAAPTWDDACELAAEVLVAARDAGVTLGCAESCTGGLVEGALTAVPGSSSSVMGAIGSYACSVKHGVLGVTQEVLDTVGPVSPECAAQMAEGAVRALGCDLAVSVTGIAGPSGEEPGKPVGFVWFGVSRDGATRTESVVFAGDRAEVRLRAVMHALGMLKQELS